MTRLASYFQMAEERNQSVAFLLTGRHSPLTAAEYHAWVSYKLVLARIEQQRK